MWAKHDSRDIWYRSPYGAVSAGTKVTLRLDVWDATQVHVSLLLWIEGKAEKRIEATPSDAGDHVTFEAQFSTRVLGPAWYAFEITDEQGTVSYYGPHEGTTGGEGLIYDTIGPSYQVTVYQKRKVYPEWYEQAIVYQIFPDRFSRGSDWKKRTKESMAKKRKAGKREVVKKWDTPAHYLRDEAGVIQSWEFWGGTLKGIEEKLPYLQEMGFSALYLNPVFEAFSNHRYDTADYFKIDPMLGDTAAFRSLCKAAKAHGISIILDGVFNHAGSDSRYFNRFGTYATPGAWQGPRSKYRDWFLLNDDGSYESWWGIGDLPAWNKASKDYQRFIYGKGGVIEHWLQLGARGWRLDVADELTDSFIAGIKSAEDRVQTDSVLLGEVWEDASHKVAYGSMRHYLCGHELDSVMNYPFREALLGFLVGEWSASALSERMASLKENYPPRAFYECLNLLSSHDRERLITRLGAPPKEELSDEERKNYRVQGDALNEARAKVWLAVLVQMLSPGVPSVYYGDEVGMQGYTDPYNRGPYPWSAPDEALRSSYASAIQLRRMFDIAVEGDFEPFFYGEDVYGFWRLPKTRVRKGHEAGIVPGKYPAEALCVLINRSPYEAKELRIPRRGETADELLNGEGVHIEDSECIITLPQLGSKVIYFHNSQQYSKPLKAGAGIVAHITSLPGSSSSEERGHAATSKHTTRDAGTFGPAAYRFVDFLKKTGNTYWQVLPLHPTDPFHSPYAGLSALAGNTDLCYLQQHTWDELFAWMQDGTLVSRLQKEVKKDDPLQVVWKSLTKRGFNQFVKENESWLKPYATFMAIRDREIKSARRKLAQVTPGKRKHFRNPESIVWQEWPKKYATYTPELAQEKRLQKGISMYEFKQFVFETQWQALKRYAHAAGIQIIGDLPMYVSEDSADTWSHPRNFKLDSKGYKTDEAGVPPDEFTPQGQMWGNPTYNWDHLERHEFSWWIERFRRELSLYDYVRLDHFVGFQNYYQIPVGKKVTEGHWFLGPGAALFKRAYQEFGPLPFIAEDLGTVTPSVRSLLAQCGFAGMDIAEFYKGDLRNWYDSVFNKISYTSTHDTNTLCGWVQASFDIDDETEAKALTSQILDRVLQSSAEVVMVPLQDVLGLGAASRMNTPGTEKGNWQWQATADELCAIEESYAERLKRDERYAEQP